MSVVRREYESHRRKLWKLRLLFNDIVQRSVQRPQFQRELRRVRQQLRRQRADVLWKAMRRSQHRCQQLRRLWTGLRGSNSLLHQRNVQRVRRRSDEVRDSLRRPGLGRRQLRRVRKCLRLRDDLRQRDVQCQYLLGGTDLVRAVLR